MVIKKRGRGREKKIAQQRQQQQAMRVAAGQAGDVSRPKHRHRKVQAEMQIRVPPSVCVFLLILLQVFVSHVLTPSQDAIKRTGFVLFLAFPPLILSSICPETRDTDPTTRSSAH